MIDFRRIADGCIAAIALVCVAPLLVVAAVAIRAETRGPVFFRQSRVGRGKRLFIMWKLRTMIHRDSASVDQRTEKVLALQSDARITRVGRFLRRTSLDELPQLLNVLSGHMALVGPRPVLPEQLAAIPGDYDARFSVRPGLTGLAQISGRRSLSWYQQLAKDVEYVATRSLGADLMIMARTINVVMRGTDIYGSEGNNWRNAIRSNSLDQK